MKDATVYARAGNVVAAEFGDEILILNMDSWVYVDLDRTGSAIWQILEQPATLSALVEVLTQSYEVEHSQCGADTKAFLDGLVAQGVVVTRER